MTASFAEAMTPWVLQHVHVTSGEIFRLCSLSPGLFGKVLPDLVLATAAGIVPCEVKHYLKLKEMTATALQGALMQLMAGMISFPAQQGYLVAAIALDNPVDPYRVEVIECVS